MSKKWLFAVWVAYIAWVVAATFYGKNKENLKKDLENAKTWNEKFKIVFGAVVDTHINMIEKVKEEVFTEENMKKFEKYKEEVLKIFDSYKEKWEILVKELKEKWVDYSEKASKKLKELYEEKKDEIEKLKWLSLETVNSLKEKLYDVFSKTEKEIKQEVEKNSK